MRISLTVIDHHPISIDISKLNNIKLITAKNIREFYSNAREYLKKDYDLAISDEDPDGITAVIIFSLSKNKKINFMGDRNGLKKEKIKEFEKSNIKRIITFDWFAFNYSDIEEFYEIIYINPRTSNLPNVNTSDIVYNALPETGRFGRDLSAIGTVCDYAVDNCKEKINSVILEYNDLFPELVELAKDNKLDRYNIYKIDNKETKFYDLSLMFWAPYIIQENQGNETLIKLIIENRGFSIRDLFKGSSNIAVSYLRAIYLELKNLINEEKKNFYENKKEIGNLTFYESKVNKKGFLSKFSSIMSDEQPYGKVIVIKSVIENKLYYSLRTKKAVYKLGELLSKLEVGGGHEVAAGAVIPIEKEEWFENELIKAISPLNLEK